MTHKLSPKNIRICPGCPPKDLELDVTPKFKFTNPEKNTTTKTITIFNNTKNKLKGKLKTLF